MPQNHELFNGQFTRKTRSALHDKRKALGFTMQKAAHFCQVNVSTYRRWEEGPTKSCTGDKIQLLMNFLYLRSDFKYIQYDMHSNSFHIAIQRSLPDDIYKELEQQFNIIHLCQNHLPFLRQYIQDLGEFNKSQIKKFIRNNQK